MLISTNHHLHLFKYDYPWFYSNICDQVSIIEFEIQKWWADRIDVDGKEVNILNSGMGAYALPFCIEKGAAYTRLIDMDPITEEISIQANEDGSWCHMMMDISFDYESIPESDIYINTSCEHSYHMKKVIPKDKLCVLSGCNLTKRGHINLIHSCNDLIRQSDLSTVIQTDEMIFSYKDELGLREYNQYFVIGKK
jgi:hypothetical protein